MGNQALIYMILLISFVFGSLYNIKIRKESMYNIKLTNIMKILLVISTIVLLTLGYIGGNTWKSYLLALAGSVLLLSGVSSQGIHEKGIYHLYGRGILPKLTKWEDIKKVDIDKNKLKSISTETRRMGVNQNYSSEAMEKIKDHI